MKKFILTTLLFSACVSETETAEITKIQVLDETKTVKPQIADSKTQDSQYKGFPKWLKSRFPDTVEIDYAYGYAKYTINDFIELKNDLSLVIVSWDDAVCRRDSAYTFKIEQLISNLSVGHICDNPSPDFGYEYQKYNLDQDVIVSTTFKEYLPDSIEQEIINGEDINSREYMIYDTIVDYYKVNNDGLLKKL